MAAQDNSLDQHLGDKVKVVIAGPPRSGKSVFLGGLCANLPRNLRHLLRCCPDGEGSWTYKSDKTQALRRKGSFTKAMVDWYCRVLRNPISPITLVDIGGKITDENRRILTEGQVEYGIILSSDPKAVDSWKVFLGSVGVEVLAAIESRYSDTKDCVADGMLSVHHLERGEDVSSRPAIQKVAERILAIAGGQKEDNMTENHVINLGNLASSIGKIPVERSLPNGRVVTQICWEGKDLSAVAELLHNQSSKLGRVVDIDGPAPAWLVAAICHEVHPAFPRLNSPDGFVAVGCQRPSGAGTGIDFKVVDLEDGWTLVEFSLNPSVPLAPDTLDHIAPPSLGMGAKVVLSGRGPNWLVASLAMAYHGTAKCLACYQPGTGATVCWTHSTETSLGTVCSFTQLP